MTHVITSLCLRDNGCSAVCPVECITAGSPANHWPTYYIDPHTCIDCGACIPECPYSAIFPEDEVPAAFKASGGEILNQVGLTGCHEAMNHHGEAIVLETTRTLEAGELVDLRDSIALNRSFFA
jgi:NAD-dependent dihydropyrimidine dehydrogenase PreA subunit